LKKKIDDFTESCPLLELMANKAMKERHWDRMATLTGHTFDLDSENFMLRDIMKAPLLQYKPVQASTLTYFSTCPFRQLTKKSTCPIQSFSCPKKFIKITKTREYSEQISSGSLNYLLNLGRVTSEGSRNNDSINRN
jgi:hypothetical protein